MTWRVIQADVLAGLGQLAEASVQCVVTSPPYWALRDYGVAGQIGLEPTPDAYIERMVAVFREVRRVLRPDGTCWLNMGDTYSQGGRGGVGPKSTLNSTRPEAAGAASRFVGRPRSRLARKQLLGMPWQLALALQADGWWLRQDIIWYKPNTLPDSAPDRCVKSHEYLFLLGKSVRYYFDREAIKEVARHDQCRNKRSVWTIATQPYPEAHFATFPEKLVEPCIRAGTSAKGCCPVCGTPWRRVVERHRQRTRPGATTRTTGWEPTCECTQQEPVPCMVLDPFCGSGTVGAVAIREGRGFAGIDFNPEYVALAEKRIADAAKQPKLFYG